MAAMGCMVAVSVVRSGWAWPGPGVHRGGSREPSGLWRRHDLLRVVTSAGWFDVGRSRFAGYGRSGRSEERDGVGTVSRLETWRSRAGVRAWLPGALLIGFGFAVFVVLLDGVRERGDLSTLDQPVLDWLVGHRGTTMRAVFAAITLVSGPSVLPALVLVACAVWVAVRREWWAPGIVAGAMVASTLLSLAIKGLVDRPRPPLATMDIPGAETTASFPSGHTIGTATLLLVVGYLAWSRHANRRTLLVGGLVAVVGTLAVGLSRLYLGYHFLTDVLAAVALAVVVLGFVVAADRLHAVNSGRPQQDSNLQPTD
ncbi:MAG: phosphatase PAP2 family protein [Cellulomonas sp.]